MNEFVFFFVIIYQYLSLFVIICQYICFMTDMKKTGGKSAWVGLVAPQRAEGPLWIILYFYMSVFVSICHYLSLFVSICFMTNVKNTGTKSLDDFVFLFVIICHFCQYLSLSVSICHYFSVFVSICQYLFDDKYEKDRREICLGLVAPRRAGVPLWMI